MKKEIADLWIADLRDPANKQTTGVLYDGNGYCCLGRLAVVMGVEPRMAEVFDGDNPSFLKRDYYFGEEIAVLDDRIRHAAGVGTGTGYVPELDAELSSLNDEGLTFSQIADIVAEFWESI